MDSPQLLDELLRQAVEAAELSQPSPTAPSQRLAPSVNFKAHLPVPHAKQREFIYTDALRVITRAGRRGGKTVGVSILAVESFLGVNQYFPSHRRVLYATPTADQIQRFWTEVCRDLAEGIELGVYKKNETEHSITLPGTEFRIRAKTAWNADTLRGDYADLLILDEFQLMHESTWEEVGAPMLMDNNGRAYFIYTPPSLRTTATSKAKDLRYASKMYKRAAADTSGRWKAIHFTSHDNPNLSRSGILEVTADMTALAIRQEIEAEDVDEVPGALWTRALIESTRVDKIPCDLQRVVVGVDPSGSSTTEAGIVTVGLGADNHLYIFRDDSLLAPSPLTWATAATSAYHQTKADRVVGERNFGGDMVESTIRTADDRVSYKDVVASRGKYVRAEPIAAVFERGMGHIVGQLSRLEEEMCTYVPGAAKSPNRLDGAVWAATELVEGGGLGLLEFFKSGMAQQMIDQAKAASATGLSHTSHASTGQPNSQPVVVSGSGVVSSPPPESCPNCHCTCVVVMSHGPHGTQRRCQECGHQYGVPNTSIPTQSRKGQPPGLPVMGRLVG